MHTTPTASPLAQMPAGPDAMVQRHTLAIKRIQAKNGFTIHLLVYLAINTISVVSWALTEAGKPFPAGFFWPIFLIAAWGVGLVIHGYSVYRGNAYTEARIQREMKQLP
jgi:hypothetical protein